MYTHALAWCNTVMALKQGSHSAMGCQCATGGQGVQAEYESKKVGPQMASRLLSGTYGDIVHCSLEAQQELQGGICECKTHQKGQSGL